MMPALPDAHAQALLTAVQGALAGVTTYLDVVPSDAPDMYVVVWSDSALSSQESLGDLWEHGSFHPAITVVANSVVKVRQARDRLEVLFVDGVQVEGRLCELERLSSTVIAKDDDVPDYPRYWCRDTLELRSYAA